MSNHGGIHRLTPHSKMMKHLCKDTAKNIKLKNIKYFDFSLTDLSSRPLSVFSIVKVGSQCQYDVIV